MVNEENLMDRLKKYVSFLDERINEDRAKQKRDRVYV